MGSSAGHLHDYMPNVVGLKEVRLGGGGCTPRYGSGLKLVIIKKRFLRCAIGIC